ncbi:MAG: hypothetical protein ACUVTC_06990, partial [Candidatus Bathycorpusculaceae bacterium]
MKIERNQILALSLALLLSLPIIAIAAPTANAEEADEVPVNVDSKWRGVWYKFETPLVTLIFPAGGKKPMFLWWYTKDNSTIYVAKFKGVIEYLIIDKPYYQKRFQADNETINSMLWNNQIEPKLRYRYGYGKPLYNYAVNQFLDLLLGLHRAYLPFSACNWTLTQPELVVDGDSSYWSFNFTLTEIYGHQGFKFAENNIEIRCRFYNSTTTEVPDEENYRDYNYTVAAGQLKFDFVVRKWEWNIDKINRFLEDYGIEIPVNKTGLVLWVNIASIKIENLTSAENEVQYEAQHHVEAEIQVENGSNMQNAMIGGEYYVVNQDETSQDEKPVQTTLQLRERFRERIRAYFACGKADVPVGFFEFVPWARLINATTGDTVNIVNVTASYIAAGGHLRLFICYPYFGSYILEHDP